MEVASKNSVESAGLCEGQSREFSSLLDMDSFRLVLTLKDSFPVDPDEEKAFEFWSFSTILEVPSLNDVESAICSGLVCSRDLSLLFVDSLRLALSFRDSFLVDLEH